MNPKKSQTLPAKESRAEADGWALTRRSFMVGSLAGGLVMGFGGLTAARSARAELAAHNFSPVVWFEMEPDGTTWVNIAKAEMGQHVGTALARIVADELGVAWKHVRIRHVDSDPKWGYMVTGGSWSVFTSFAMLSRAGAAGRTVLLEQGAKLLGAAPGNCTVADSEVRCGDQSISYSDIIARGDTDRVFTAEELEALPIKPASERRLIGTRAMALDIPAKTDGSARYGIDVELDGMVYARPVLPPTRYGSSVVAVDESAAKDVRGYQGHHVITDPSSTLQGWVMALADSQWGAIKAADALNVEWNAGPTAGVSEQDLLAEGERLASQSGSGTLFVNEGDVDSARSGAAHTVEATYRTSSVLHFHLEPVNATVEERDGVWHVHTGNQWQSLIIPLLAQALEVEDSQVVMHQYYLGGGFGRRLFGDYALPAALTAKALGRPVKAVFTREDDARFDCIRSPSVCRLSASLDSDNRLTGIEHAIAAGWPTLSMAPGFMGEGVDGKGQFDPFSANGADHWYTVPNHRVRAINNDLAQRTFLPGWLRSVGPGWINFGVESFMDEVAHATGRDPIDFRLDLLDATGRNAGSAPNSVGGASRLANVLRRVREKSGWGGELAADEGLGVATGYGQERNMPTWIGCVARVRVDRESGVVKVSDIYLDFDCGTVVHPDGALAQAEGSALWGLSMALHEGTAIEKGQVAARNLDRYSPLRLADVPRLHIDFVDSTEFPVGLGEPAVSVVGPAVANAIFAAVGVRMRDLPIRPDAIKAALLATA
ncbi:xanthine dehydrogenase family protein molybdopterin-binding subunit [Elongatibacter sediminis]|uniref:Molybdopterin cofactor-binding domain-containing protein n=1 Tax=Elongatibacter sediminis TaxID=3119006 RepID=A0AAW9RNQ3_9GAMM